MSNDRLLNFKIKKNTLLILTLSLFLIVFLTTTIYAESFKQGIILDVKKTCTGSNSSICTASATCDITIKRPKDNMFLVQAGVMTNKGDGNFNYTLNESQTSNLGEYQWDMFCCDLGECGEGHGEFMITPNGEELSTSGSILYIIFEVILFGLIGMLFYFIMVMPKDNERDESGVLIKIVKLKYLRIVFIVLLYFLIILLLNLTNGLAVNFSTLSMFSGIIGFLFELMVRVAWVFTLIMVLWVLYLAIKDKNTKREFKKIKRSLGI